MDVTISDFAWFSMKQLGPAKVDRLKAKLIIKPKRTHRLQASPDPILLYKEDGDRIGIPREYFLQHKRLDNSIKREVSSGSRIDVPFNGELLRDQGDAVEAVLADRQRGGLGGIVQAAPGWGKTVMTLGAWTRFSCNALVIVHKVFLLNQWINRIRGTFDKDGKVVREGFAPSARIGVIRGNKCEFGSDYDISIATIQTLAKKMDTYPKELWDAFGLVIADEVHRVAAPTWARVVPNFNSSYRLGLSATPRRKDGADDVFLGHIGQILYKSNVKQVTPMLRRVFTPFVLPRFPTFNPAKAGKEVQLRFLCKDVARNRLIVEELKLATERGRKVIVLSERRRHLETLNEMYCKVKPSGCTTSFYVGGMEQEDLNESELATVIFSTYQMCAEGLDIPGLDTAFLVSPMSDVEQSVGRIMREYDDKKEPRVVDFIDGGVPHFDRLWEKRQRFYVKEGMWTPGGKK